MQINYISELKTKAYRGSQPTPWLGKNVPRVQVAEPFVLNIDGETYIVPAGYIWDGASIPRLLWSIFPPNDPAYWRAACFHDYCYSHLYRNGVMKSFADEAFYRIMLYDNTPKWKAETFKYMVKLFGKGGW